MTNAANYFFLPVLLQVLLSLSLYIYLAVAKSRALTAGTVDLDRRALHSDAWPEQVQQINNNIRNQFEVPVLFYVLMIVLYLLGSTGWIAQILAWSFAVSRLIHAYIHTGSNHVPARKPVFMFGCLVLFGMLLLATYSAIA